MPTFDGDNLLITLDSAVYTVDVEQDIYSEWKKWMLLGVNDKYEHAFDTTGGDPISATSEVAPYFFLKNDSGWRIKGPEEDGTFRLVGNLFARDPDVDIFIPTTGNFTQTIILEVTSKGTVEIVSTGSGLSAAQDQKLTEVHGELRSIEGGEHHSWFMRVFMAVLGNKIIGPDPGVAGTVTARDMADTKDRISAPVNQHGWRTSSPTKDGD